MFMVLLAAAVVDGKMADEKYKSRLGDVTVLPYSGNTVWYRYYEDDIIKDRGMHGVKKL